MIVIVVNVLNVAKHASKIIVNVAVKSTVLAHVLVAVIIAVKSAVVLAVAAVVVKRGVIFFENFYSKKL